MLESFLNLVNNNEEESRLINSLEWQWGARGPGGIK
jgi:hypothetical protein